MNSKPTDTTLTRYQQITNVKFINTVFPTEELYKWGQENLIIDKPQVGDVVLSSTMRAVGCLLLLVTGLTAAKQFYPEVSITGGSELRLGLAGKGVKSPKNCLPLRLA